MNPIYDDIISACEVCEIENKIKFVKALNKEIVKAIQDGKDCIKINKTSSEELQYVKKHHCEIRKVLNNKGYRTETNLLRLTEKEKDYWYIHIYWNKD